MESTARNKLCTLYVALAALALVATTRQNIGFVSESGFAAFWPALLVNRATASITVDIFLFALAADVWMVLEARRLGVKGVWLYVIFGMLVAISVTFPLFLVARERRLGARGAPGATGAEPAPSGPDKVGLAILGLAITAFAVWCTVR